MVWRGGCTKDDACHHSARDSAAHTFSDPITGLVECRWSKSYSLTVPDKAIDPTDWTSGIYLAKLTADPSGKQSYIIFVVRDDDRPSQYLFQSSITTYQAYNNWGGKSLYDY